MLLRLTAAFLSSFLRLTGSLVCGLLLLDDHCGLPAGLASLLPWILAPVRTPRFLGSN